MEYQEEEFENLDTSWIKEYNNIDEIYSDFYKEQLETISIYFLYVNRGSDLFHISKKIIDLSNAVIDKNTIVKLLKKNMILEKKKYRPISILKYNLTISPNDLEKYIDNTDKYTFLESEKEIKDIKFNNSITLFHDINGIYFVLHEQWDPGTHKTKKIFIKNKLKRKKTKKNRLK